MTEPNKPSDSTPDKPKASKTSNPWDDLDVEPLAPSKGQHVADNLYTNKTSTSTQGMGLAFAWVGHPLALPVFLVGMVALAITSCAAKYETAAKQEASNKVAAADMDHFQKAREKVGFQSACLTIDKGHVPYQYRDDCNRAREAAKARGVGK